MDKLPKTFREVKGPEASALRTSILVATFLQIGCFFNDVLILDIFQILLDIGLIVLGYVTFMELNKVLILSHLFILAVSAVIAVSHI